MDTSPGTASGTVADTAPGMRVQRQPEGKAAGKQQGTQVPRLWAGRPGTSADKASGTEPGKQSGTEPGMPWGMGPGKQSGTA